MSKFELQCTSIILLLIVTVFGAMEKACYNPPTSNYSALIDCCQGSAITYSDEVMTLFSDLSNNSTRKRNSKELVLMNVCAIHYYLNYSGVIKEDGAVEKEPLIAFLVDNLRKDEIKSVLRSSTDKCLRVVDSTEMKENNRQTCNPYYSALIDCIQKEIFINCPDSAKNSSTLCSTCRSFVEYCGVGTLQESCEHLEYDNPDYGSSSSESDSSESESYDSSSDLDSSDSESYSSSDSDSDCEYETETGPTEAAYNLETTPAYVYT